MAIALAASSGHAVPSASKNRSCAAALALISLASTARAEPAPREFNLKCLGQSAAHEVVMMKIKMEIPKAFNSSGTEVVAAEIQIAGVKPNRDEPGVSGFLGTMSRPLEFQGARVLYSEYAGPLIFWSEDEAEGDFFLSRITDSLHAEIGLPKTGEALAYTQRFSTECYPDDAAAPADWAWQNPFSEWPY